MMLGAYLAHRVIVAAYSSQGPERASKARAESERNLRGALIILAVACTAAIVYVLVA